MIYRLQKKFILVSVFSVFFVILVVFLLIGALSVRSTNAMVDALVDEISVGGGRFPESFFEPSHKPDMPKKKPNFEFITPETPFATRHFTIWISDSGELLKSNTEFIYSVSENEAFEYAEKALSKNNKRGWINGYRYKVFDSKDGISVVFVDGNANIASLRRTLIISGLVLFLAGIIVLILIILLSKRAMKPIAEGYENQKRFITDANHELKTPLTLILANIDIAESELGKNEWLDDMRSEGERMRALVDQLVVLSRLDEYQKKYREVKNNIPLSEVLVDTVSEFDILAAHREKILVSDIEENLFLNTDEALIRRLFSILLDNAVKYCDAYGKIVVSLKKRRGICLNIENTYKEAEKVELSKIFDRFYRADPARTFEGGFGIGLSMARSICENQGFQISAYRRNKNTIGFKILF